MSNSPAAKAFKKANFEHFSNALSGFCDEHEIDTRVFGDGVHWRLKNGRVTLDCWPTTGKYWIKQTNLRTGLSERMNETGQLPHDYNKLDTFLRELFLTEEDV